MAAGFGLQPNYSNFPLVGSDGIRNDSINPTEILNYLFKKSFGFPNTSLYDAYNNEAVGSFNSTPYIINKNLYSQPIPNIAPTDLSNDLTWTNGTRSISSNYPYLARYENVLMQVNIGTYPSFYVEDNNGNKHTKIIPMFFDPDQSYIISLSTTNNVGLDFGQISSGSWIMDTDSGVLTFYDDVTIGEGVSSTNPPRISYWRYEGLTGNANIVEVFDA
jgi:hypothetical protein